MKFSRNRFLQFDFQIAHLSHRLAAAASKRQYLVEPWLARAPGRLSQRVVARWQSGLKYSAGESKHQKPKVPSCQASTTSC